MPIDKLPDAAGNIDCRDLERVLTDPDLREWEARLEAARQAVMLRDAPKEAAASESGVGQQLAAPLLPLTLGKLQEMRLTIPHANQQTRFLAYRDGPAWVQHTAQSRYDYAPAGTIEARMAAWFDLLQEQWTFPPLQCALAFAEFLDIHPYFEANGRTIRLLMGVYLVQCHYPPFLPDEATRKEYTLTLANYSQYRTVWLFYRFLLRQLTLDTERLLGEQA